LCFMESLIPSSGGSQYKVKQRLAGCTNLGPKELALRMRVLTLNRDPDTPAQKHSIIYRRQVCNLGSQSPVQALHHMEGLLAVHIL
jgi:hypothetical protein